MPIPQMRSNQGWKHSRKIISQNKISNKQSSSGGQKRRKKPKKEPFFSKKLKKNILYFFTISTLIGIISILSLLFWISGQLPDPNKLTDREIAQSTKIYDRTGEIVLYEIHGAEKRTLVELDQIPKNVINATISIEDQDFYKHKGFSLWAIFRSAVTNVIFGKHAGGSTLTQQFVKNSILTNEHSYERKIKELLIAYRLEKKFSKEEILKMYFNEIPYGSTAYGVQAASQRYFAKNIQDLNLSESAILAALPKGPSYYSPYGSHKDKLIIRQQYILDQMVSEGYITEEEAQVAKDFELVFKKPGTNIKAPHFVMYVKEILSKKYGQKTIEQGGLKIITSLDLYKQEIAEEVIKERGDINEEKFEATNAALLAIDPKTGQILTMVGSRDYFNDEIDGQVNIATALRQPGSSIKPLIYTSAFMKGYTPKTILYDVVTNFSVIDEEPYQPHNYDLNELGPVSIKKALAGSLNIPAVKAIYLAGKDNVLDLAEDFGYSSFTNRKRLGLSLVLGGGEVRMIEHVNAFSVFAREGYIRDLTPILKIEDRDGNILEEYEKPKERKVLDPKIARQINNILSDNNARAYAFGLNNWLTLGDRQVAAKTGTTNDYHDAWTVGYTPSIVTGVWVGNNNNDAMKRGAAGGVVAAPIWHDFMEKVLGDTPKEEFKVPEEVETGIDILDGIHDSNQIVKIDKISGLLANENTPPELIIEKSFYAPHSILHFINKNDPLGKAPENPENNSQYTLWEEAIQTWHMALASTSTSTTETIPTETDTVHTIENKPGLIVYKPKSGDIITIPKLVTKINTESRRGVNRVEYYLNDSLFHTQNSHPYNIEKDITFLNNGFHTLTIRSCDDVSNCTSEKIDFNLRLRTQKVIKKPSITTIAPINGLAISNTSFPITIINSINNNSSIAEITTIITNEKNETIFSKKISNPIGGKINIKWLKSPISGTYTIKNTIKSWRGDIIKSNNIILIIKNLE